MSRKKESQGLTDKVYRKLVKGQKKYFGRGLPEGCDEWMKEENAKINRKIDGYSQILLACPGCGLLYDIKEGSECTQCQGITAKETKGTLENIIAEMENLEHNIIATKGREYTQGSEDRAKNFRGAAEDLDIPILYSWWVYIKKQMDAILNYVKNERTYSGEVIEQRVADAVNYLHLLIYIIRQGGKK